jgi:membrane fusion protein (multidrug efflux system)
MNRIVLFISLYFLVYNTGCTSKNIEKEEAIKYTATSPLKIDTSFTKEYVAQIQSEKNIEIRAQEKGYLQTINVDEGQDVKAGQLLFKIMPKMYEAEYFKTQALVKEAELEMMNSKTLADKNIVSKTELAIKEAKLDEAKADMALAKLHLSLTEIKAPYDGVIDRIKLKQGSLIDEGSLLTTLSDNKNIYAYFNVTENEYLNYKSRVAGNEDKNIHLLLANGQQYQHAGKVEIIEGEFDNETGNIAFRAKFPNQEMLLKHGETGKVQMKVVLNNALLIPQKATYEIQDKIYVFVIDKTNVVKSRNITIKNRLPDLYVVDTGLAADDKILLEGVQIAKDDDKIEYKFIEPEKVISNLQLIKQ